MKKRIQSIIAIALVLPLLMGILPMADAKSFIDVWSFFREDRETFDAIMYVSDQGYMAGTATLPSLMFSPDTVMNRAQVVQILYSMAGSPNVSVDSPVFTDVTKGKWYYNAVYWAYQNGIAAGTSATKFSPTKNVKRQDAILFLYRFACKYRSFSFGEEAKVRFADYNDISPYAREAMNWAAQYCILRPDPESFTVSPQDTVTRANQALTICRYDKNAVGFFDGKKKFGGENVEASNAMTAAMQNKLFDVIDQQFSPLQADNIKNEILRDTRLSQGKCAGISLATYFDAMGHHDFNRLFSAASMAALGSYENNELLRSAINFYQFGSNRVIEQYRTIVGSKGGMDNFCEEIALHGPVVTGAFWYDSATGKKTGHSVIAIDAKRISDGKYMITYVDPNKPNVQAYYTTIDKQGHIYFYGENLYSFEYFPSSALEDISCLDIDGPFNTLSIS